jgi:asparagine synthase (glutamine-hydrolysing)
MSYDMASRRIETRCYWRYRVVADDPPPGTVETWAEELRELLTLAVERRLRTDVPFGFFLSGGVDSSAIVALAARRLDPAAMKTFTIGFDEPSYDESPYARTIADHFGTDHFQQILNLEKAAELLPELMRRQDDPIADNSLLATHLLSRFAREQVTVALSGDGSDELFAGYDTFDALRPAQLYQAMVPSALHRLIAAGADQLPRSDRNMSFDFKLRRALRGLEHPSACWMPAWLGPTSIADLEILFERELDPEDVYSEAIDLWGQSASSSLVDRSLEFYARYYLGENLLIKADRASMYCSLEVRSPFLDRDVVDFVLRLPVSMKYRRGARKWILKQAMKPLLPESILERPKKGFGIPTTAWLRHLPAPEPAAATALGLNGTWLSKQWDDHRRGRADHRSLLWAWLSVSAAAA